MVTWLLVLLIALGLVVLWLIVAFNGLVAMRNRVQEAWSDIDVQLKRRYDLIPNLVATVKGYAAHEDSVFTKVTDARTKAMQANGPAEKSGAENAITGALKSLFAISENYPELKANTNFLELQRELADTENKIQASRRFYNGNVRDFNTKQSVFPTNIIAGMLGFKPETFFEAAGEERENVKVSF